MKLQLILLLSLLSYSGAEDWMPSAVRLLGVSGPEEIPEDEMDRFSSLADRPIDINSLSEASLLASGLFTSYQAASIKEYISRNGAILSETELGAVDGIGAAFARDLRPFIRLGAPDLPGRKASARPDADIRLRAAVKNGDFSYAVKGGVDFSGFSAAASLKGGELANIGLSYTRGNSGIVLGDFKARFGQGLLSWTGFNMTTLYTVSSFARNPGGISLSRSMSSGYAKRGVAGYTTFGKMDLSLYATLSGEVMGHVGLRTGTGSYALGLMRTEKGRPAVEADWRFTAGRFTFFGEAALATGAGAQLRAGAFLNLGYLRRGALLVRASSDEQALALGAELPWLSATLELSSTDTRRQSRVVLLLDPAKESLFRPSFRLNLRCRPADDAPYRTDCRLDLKLVPEPFEFVLRANVLHCEGYSFLTYLEAGWKKGRYSAYLRGGVFAADRWADRIYVWERDVPGNFNVPVCYGRGLMFSLYTRLRHVSARLACTLYPRSGKDGKFELRLQYDL